MSKKLKLSNGTFEWGYVISTVRADAASIVRWGRRRWQIEGFFKTMKSRFGSIWATNCVGRVAIHHVVVHGSFAGVLDSDPARQVHVQGQEALKVGWVLLDSRVMANAARDAIMPEVRLVVLEAEALRLRALQAAQEMA